MDVVITQALSGSGPAVERPAAYAGVAGAFGEEALVAHLGEDAARVGLTSFDDVLAAVAAGEASVGVVPIENSLAGSVLESWDGLSRHDVQVVAELELPVRHCLLGVPGATLADIRSCRSHPQALAQCAAYLTARGIETIASSNTALAARDVATAGDHAVAAIASARAGRRYGLSMLDEGIQARDDNTTRFFAVERERPVDLRGTKASIAFATHNRPGALLAVLQAFARADLNMTKLESRPTRQELWEYVFYADLERGDGGELAADAIADVLERVSVDTTFVRLLGCYPHAAPRP